MDDSTRARTGSCPASWGGESGSGAGGEERRRVAIGFRKRRGREALSPSPLMRARDRPAQGPPAPFLGLALVPPLKDGAGPAQAARLNQLIEQPSGSESARPGPASTPPRHPRSWEGRRGLAAKAQGVFLLRVYDLAFQGAHRGLQVLLLGIFVHDDGGVNGGGGLAGRRLAEALRAVRAEQVDVHPQQARRSPPVTNVVPEAEGGRGREGKGGRIKRRRARRCRCPRSSPSLPQATRSRGDRRRRSTVTSQACRRAGGE